MYFSTKSTKSMVVPLDALGSLWQTQGFFSTGMQIKRGSNKNDKIFSWVFACVVNVFQHDTMAADHNQFYQILDSLLSTDNDVRPEAEVSKCNI